MVDITPVNVGTTANDGRGDPLRIAFQVLNANIAALATALAATQSNTIADLTNLPNSDDGLNAGDLYWNGDALFRSTGDGLGGGSVNSVPAFLDSLLNALPTTTPTTSGTWWNDNGTFAKTP